MRRIFVQIAAAIFLLTVVILSLFNYKAMYLKEKEPSVLKTPFNNMCLVSNNADLQNSKLKIVHYIDATSCPDCSIKTLDSFEQNIKRFHLPTIIIICSKKEQVKKIKYYLRSMELQSPIFVDANYIMRDINPSVFMSTENTFLLNGKNEILANGNPLTNNSVKTKYMSEIFSIKN